MRILLDENVAVQVQPILRQVLPEHVVDHVDEVGWKGKGDQPLLLDAAAKGYDVVVTKDRSQLSDPHECQAIKRSGVHHVRFGQGQGLKALARSTAAVVAALPDVLDELDSAESQRLVSIRALRTERRFSWKDPGVDPPPYWPRGRGRA